MGQKLKTGQLAALWDVNRSTIYSWRTREHDPLPAASPGGRVFFDIDAVEEWFARQTSAQKRKE